MPLPSSSELLAFLAEIEDDPVRRHSLHTGWSLFEAVRDAGLIDHEDIDGFGRLIGELVDQDLMRCGPRHGGSPNLPAGALWDGAELQRRTGYGTTALGRADAERFRRRERERATAAAATPIPGEPDPEIYGRWFQQLGYVFDLPPGLHFPALPRSVGEKDVRVLRRYVAAVRELAGSSALNQPGVGYKVEFEPAGVRSVESSLPSDESVRALAVLFRQLYANEEEASFERVSGLLRKHVEADEDYGTAARRAALKAWRQAHSTLRTEWLERLIARRGQALGQIPPRVSPSEPSLSPDQVLSAYFYGRHIHWGRRAEQVEAWEQDAFTDASRRLLFLQAIGQLSTLYIGFAALVVSATPFDKVLEDRSAA